MKSYAFEYIAVHGAEHKRQIILAVSHFNIQYGKMMTIGKVKVFSNGSHKNSRYEGY